MGTSSNEELKRIYVRETIRTWLGVQTGLRVSIPDMPDKLARMLLRTEEYEITHRDQWGCWEFAYSDQFVAGELWKPEVDEWIRGERQRLARDVALEPLWPGGRPFALCVTHDVDMVSRRATLRQSLRGLRLSASRQSATRSRSQVVVQRIVRALGRAVFYGISRAPSTIDTIERALQIEQEFGVSASYLFTVYPPSRPSPFDCVYSFDDSCMFQRKRARIREVVRWIADHGFDVGLHGSYWSALDVDALAKEKAVLERVVEHPVRSIRQHFLHWNILSTPRLQDEAGFAVDSTLGFNRHVGFRAGTCLPFHHFDAKNNRRLNLLQVPLIVQDAPLLADNSLELNEQLAWRVVQLLLDRVAHVSGVFTLLVHPHTLLNPLVSTLFRRTIEYALSKSAWVTSLRDMDEWWRAREERLSRPATLRK